MTYALYLWWLNNRYIKLYIISALKVHTRTMLKLSALVLINSGKIFKPNAVLNAHENNLCILCLTTL
jgi:hypothetical protein